MTGESGFAKEPTGAQAQLLHALVMRDLGCALRNRTVLMTIITVLGFCALMMPQFAGSAEELPFMGAFGYALVPLFSVLEVGGTIMLFAMAEERAHGTYEVMARAGATLPLLVASKLIAGIVLCVVISLVAALFSGMWNANLLEFAAVVAVGSVPFLLLAAGCGLLSRQEMRVNAFSFALVLLCIAPLLSALVPAAGTVSMACPVAFLAGFGAQALGGSIESLHMSLWPLVANLVAWTVLSALWLRWCIRRAQTQESA